MYYAQIDETGICFAITQTAGLIERADMVEIAEYDLSLLGKKRVGDIWEVVPEPEPVIPEPTEQELVNAELLLGQAQLAESQATIEETAALVLLELVGGGI